MEAKCLETWEILDVDVDSDMLNFRERGERCERLRIALDSMLNLGFLFRFLKNSKKYGHRGSVRVKGFLMFSRVFPYIKTVTANTN